MLYLKNLPYTGHDKDIKNQFDNSNIYIISDHGSTVKYKDSYQIKLLKLLNKNKIISDEWVQIMLDYSSKHHFSMGADCIMFRKPRLGNHFLEPKNSGNPLVDFYEFNHFITLGDLMPMIEADINFDLNKNMIDKSNSYFRPNAYFEDNPKLDYKTMTALDEIFKNNIVVNPLNNIDALKRKTITTGANDWRYFPDKTSFPKLTSLHRFDGTSFKPNTKTMKNTIYDDSLWTKTE